MATKQFGLLDSIFDIVQQATQDLGSTFRKYGKAKTILALMVPSAPAVGFFLIAIFESRLKGLWWFDLMPIGWIIIVCIGPSIAIAFVFNVISRRSDLPPRKQNPA